MRAGVSRWLDEAWADQARVVKALPPRQLSLVLVAVAALTIHVAQVLSRWPATSLPGCTWLPVLGLFGCFLGFGLGCALSWRCAVAACLPLLAVQALLVLALGHWFPPAGQTVAGSVIVSIGCALLLLPLGRLNRQLLLRLPRLRAHALCLLGGLGGVAVSAFLLLLWTPPNAVWALAWLGAVPLLMGRGRRVSRVVLSLLGVALAQMLAPGGGARAAGSGLPGLWPLSVGLYALALLAASAAGLPRPAIAKTRSPDYATS